MCAEKLSSVLGAKKGMVAQRSSRTKSQQEEALTLEAPSATREAHRKFTGCCTVQEAETEIETEAKTETRKESTFQAKCRNQGQAESKLRRSRAKSLGKATGVTTSGDSYFSGQN